MGLALPFICLYTLIPLERGFSLLGLVRFLGKLGAFPIKVAEPTCSLLRRRLSCLRLGRCCCYRRLRLSLRFGVVEGR